MMSPMVPPSAAEVTNLIALISDPQGAKKRLDELVAATAEANAALAVAVEHQSKAAVEIENLGRVRNDVERAVSDLEGERHRHKVEVAEQRRLLEKRQAELNAHEGAVGQEHARRMAELAQLEGKILSREAPLNAQAKALDDREAKIAAEKSDLAYRAINLAQAERDVADKLKKLKAIIG